MHLAEQHSNSVVTKSNVLIEANYKLTVTEQKIILYLISQINKDDEDFQTYSLPIQHFYEMLGYSGSPKYSEMREITKNLMRKVLEIREGNKLKQMSWVSYVEYDEQSGRVSVSFDPRLKPYLLQLKREFTTYRLKNVMELKSSYSIRMYEILKRWQYIGEVDIALDDLREMMGVTDKYQEYHNFKKRVLSPAEKEITEKTDIVFEYQEIKRGRRVVGIRFILKEQLKELKEPESRYQPFLSLLENVGHYMSERQFDKVSSLAQKIYGEGWFEEIYQLMTEIVSREDIREPVAFLAYVLNEKWTRIQKGRDHREISIAKPQTQTKSRKEILPDWFEDYQKEFLQSLNPAEQKNGDETNMERRRKELEEQLKRYKMD
jgi:plasmid replication initiation protein